MSYYNEVIEKIDKLIENKEYLKAGVMIEEELSMPYVPKDLEIKLIEYADNLKTYMQSQSLSLNDEELESYLHSDPLKQLMAANYLDSLNLRNYLDMINDFLKGDGDDKAKALIISSLIDQDINEEVSLKKDGLEYTFIPHFVEPIEMSDGYESAMNYLNEMFSKNPSYLKMLQEIIIKECFMKLPLSYTYEEGLLLAKKAICYLYDCLKDDDAKEEFIKTNVSDKELEIMQTIKFV